MQMVSKAQRKRSRLVIRFNELAAALPQSCPLLHWKARMECNDLPYSPDTATKMKEPRERLVEVTRWVQWPPGSTSYNHRIRRGRDQIGETPPEQPATQVCKPEKQRRGTNRILLRVQAIREAAPGMRVVRGRLLLKVPAQHNGYNCYHKSGLPSKH